MNKLNDYVDQLKAFKNHLNNEVDAIYKDPSDKKLFDFYNSYFEITFRGKTVKLGNGAEIFDAIEDLINYEISEWEETK